MLYAIQNGIIDLQEIQKDIAMKKDLKYLEKHPYKIWQGDNGKWYTYLPDKNSKRGSKLKKRTTKEQIEQDVIEYWKSTELDPTVKEVFDRWLDGKMSRAEIEPATRDRYESQFEQCMNDIASEKIRNISEYDLEEYVLDVIHKKELTVKGFANMRTLLYGIFRTAKKMKLIEYSITEVVKDMDISRKAFRRNTKTDEEEVFTEDELPVVLKYLEENQDIINLGILLMFKTGLRIGELCALKKEDVDNNIIHVRRTEVRHKGARKHEMIYSVRDFPKTDAGIRDVIVPDQCLWILKRIKALNPFGEYVFERNGERLKAHNFRTRMGTVCKHTNSVQKSPHKIRKTYGTILIDSGLEESMIISQMGHTEIRTTKDYYYKNRKSVSGRTASINNVCGL